MKICFFGFAKMDYKGEEINEAFFLKMLVDELSERGVKSFYFFKENDTGLHDENLYNDFSIKAERLCINQYTDYPFKEYVNYTEEELYEVIEFNHQVGLIKNGMDSERKLLTTVTKCLENIKKFDSEYNFDLFVFFGNTIISNIIRAYCKKNNKQYYNMENGYFRPYTLMVDPKGVNYNSTIPREFEFYRNLSLDSNRLSEYLMKPEYAGTNSAETLYYRKIFYNYYGIHIEDKKRTSNINNKMNKDFFELPEEYIYVPFQLETDSQIIKHSPNVKTMNQLVEVTSKSLERYNRDNNKNLKIIYKTHPLYTSELKIMDLEGIQQICKQDPNLIFLTDGNNKELLSNAKAVITINSTVGLEALIAHKPVITLGQAFYNISGLVHVVENLDYLSGTLEKALTVPVDSTVIDKFLYYLRFHYFVEIFRSSPDKQSIKRLANKLINIE
ncbi:hypothetical protein [Mesobacillus thioparans]|uniref:capsular polysaccharide export protein, LipB/KpsS family n=1 Tax=Mesobacillus thioparans TaxID=370439 RepID=UPI0039F04E70